MLMELVQCDPVANFATLVSNVVFSAVGIYALLLLLLLFSVVDPSPLSV